MPVTVSSILSEARFMLNDVAGTLYGDAALLPAVRKAYEEFESWAESYNLQLVKKDTGDIIPQTVEGNYVVMRYTGDGAATNPQFPADFRIPIRVWEKAVGEDRAFYVQMEESEFRSVVNTQAGRETYGYWMFDGKTLYLPKISTPSSRNILIQYIGSTLTFTDQNSTLYDIHFKTHLAARTAALAAMYIGQNETRAAAAQDDSNQALDRIVEALVRKNQGAFGIRRIPFGMTRRIRESFNKWWS